MDMLPAVFEAECDALRPAGAPVGPSSVSATDKRTGRVGSAPKRPKSCSKRPIDGPNRLFASISACRDTRGSQPRSAPWTTQPFLPSSPALRRFVASRHIAPS
jgi:hypothetical protein